ncbi:MAG: hypothetical protein J6X55_11040 [Victivallales bacterium]|nr:hypothetical protein [Victivallales bacterium]
MLRQVFSKWGIQIAFPRYKKAQQEAVKTFPTEAISKRDCGVTLYLGWMQYLQAEGERTVVQVYR